MKRLLSNLNLRIQSLSRLERWLAALLVIGVMAPWALAIAFPMNLGWDASIGVKVWQSMQQGAAFNCLRLASRSDVGLARDVFVSTFSPGHYLLPGLLGLTRLRLGTSLAILTLMCIGGGLYGYYILYTRFLGFSRLVGLISLAVILCSWNTLVNFVQYSGGTLLVFGALPWFLMACLVCLRKGGALHLLLPPIFLAGAFLKLSFAVVGLCVVILPLTHAILNKKPWFCWRNASPAAAFALFYALLYAGYTSHGWNPVERSGVEVTLSGGVFAFAYSLAATASSAISAFLLLSRIGLALPFALEPASAMWSSLGPAQYSLVLLLGVFGAVLIWIAFTSVKDLLYRSLFAATIVVHATVMTALCWAGGVGFEDRHFWPAGSLLLPGLIHWIAHQRSNHRRATLAAILVPFAAYGLRVYLSGLQLRVAAPRSIVLGISVPDVDRLVVQKLEAFDAETQPRILWLGHPVPSVLATRTPLILDIHIPRTLRRGVIPLEQGPFRGQVERAMAIIQPSDLQRGESPSAFLAAKFPDMAGPWTCKPAGRCHPALFARIDQRCSSGTAVPVTPSCAGGTPTSKCQPGPTP